MERNTSVRFHTPVMTREVLEYLDVAKDSGTFCDCTVGGAGHLLEMLKATRKALFIGIDCDPDALAYSRRLVRPYADRCILIEENFVNIGLILKQHGVKLLNGVLFDLGASYHQLTTSQRGFSFEHDGPLTMTMSPNQQTLMEMIRRATQEDICGVLRRFGNVRNYRRIGSAIYARRHVLKSTQDLKIIVEECVHRRFLKKNLHKVFQALRIWVNNELASFADALLTACEYLTVHGRIVVISYHSGEDRIAKQLFRKLHKQGKLQPLHKKVVRPSDCEVARNPRARSAKLRAVEKCVA